MQNPEVEEVKAGEGSRGLGPCCRLDRNSIVMGVFKCAYVLQKSRKTGFTETTVQLKENVLL